MITIASCAFFRYIRNIPVYNVCANTVCVCALCVVCGVCSCVYRGQKTVEMAPHDAIVETWGDDAQGKGRSFSKQIPQHHTLTLRPGDALFLPKVVWHRVTSTPDSLAISLGVYSTTLEALTQEHEGLRQAIKTGDRLDARFEFD